MEREIKFRAKSIDNLQWCYGIMHNDGMTLFPVRVDKETICQFSGMRDKNKKEIYDGDILKTTYGHIYKVEYYECNAAFMLICYDERIDDYIGYFDTENSFEVIGNIYDNPELLEIKP